MPFGSVNITRPRNRLIYVNRNYNDPAGKTPCVIAVEYGSNRFETRTSSGDVDYSGRVITSDTNINAELELAPV